MKTVVNAICTVFESRQLRVVGYTSFVGFFVLFLFALASPHTGEFITLSSLQYLNPVLISLSVIMAALVALTMSMMVYLFKRGRSSHKVLAAGGASIGLFAPLLCCSPLLPFAMGFLAGIIPSAGGAFGLNVQRFIATHQIEIFSLAILMLILALYQNAKQVVNGVCSGVAINPGLDQ